MVMSGIGDHLAGRLFLFQRPAPHKPDLVEEYPRLLMGGVAVKEGNYANRYGR